MLSQAVDVDAAPDEELVQQVRAGETALYETLMRRYNQRLYRTARAILRDAGEAEDVVQEAHVRAYMHLDQFAGAARFSTWLTKIAVHEALARLRRHNRTAGLDMDTEKPGLLESLESSIPGPEEQALAKQAQDILEAAVDKLPDSLRAVFMMREVEEASTAETAECLGLSEEAVKVRLHRARRLLRRDLYFRVGAASSQAFGFLGERCDRVVSAVMRRIQAAR